MDLTGGVVRRVFAFLIALLVTIVVAPPAVAETTGPYHSVTIEPGEGVTLTWNDHHYAGSLEVTSASDGLVVLDHVGIDDYLLGIQEVPFSWPMEALKAQVVAARTYLAWT
ncbi:MAG: SpoIID/LytB domain-containing protein, partial [Acidimicrobiia bacterium]